MFTVTWPTAYETVCSQDEAALNKAGYSCTNRRALNTCDSIVYLCGFPAVEASWVHIGNRGRNDVWCLLKVIRPTIYTWWLVRGQDELALNKSGKSRTSFACERSNACDSASATAVASTTMSAFCEDSPVIKTYSIAWNWAITYKQQAHEVLMWSSAVSQVELVCTCGTLPSPGSLGERMLNRMRSARKKIGLAAISRRKSYENTFELHRLDDYVSLLPPPLNLNLRL